MTPCVSSWTLLFPLPCSFSLLKTATSVVETRKTIPQKNKKSAAEEQEASENPVYSTDHPTFYSAVTVLSFVSLKCFTNHQNYLPKYEKTKDATLMSSERSQTNKKEVQWPQLPDNHI